MNQLLTVFNGSSIFSKIDLRGAYNLLRIKAGDKQLKCFRTKYASYEYLVMRFGLTNAPASFQNLINDIFYDLLNIYVLVYLDDIMVFSKSEEEHNYSKKISSLISFLKEYSCFPLNEEALRQFHKLNEAFTIAAFLSHFDPSLPTIVETDASDYALGAVLSQISYSEKHPIASDSRTLLPAELNYEIHDKELLGIVWALKRRRAFLLSLSSSFEVLTDHSSLQTFMSSNILTHRRACWAEFLSEFHLSITYRPGRLATLPDSFSRWDAVYPQRGEYFIRKNPMNYQKIIKQDEIQASKFFAVKVEAFSNLIESIQKALWQDSQYRSILQDLGKGKSVKDYCLDSSSKLLVFKDCVVVPNDPTVQLSILQKRHDSPLAGHPGQEKTLKPVKRDFHWPGMTQFIKDYV
ncbi:hypothetical protein O181_107638 [Austropuccinia psidii MF-1]|uniref:Reverse transcriptase domain-containing protein n=1 Tax=Austropuccinia psidii MF-1 TaxID=1389203 RepID=A0A9Q3JR97_9BASI|nr:hypothetical protein [Austropuccinia psidii MF-1]